MSLIELPAILDRRDNLPGLLARAGQRLLDARDAAEVLEAKKLGELALHFAKVTNAANETHADCLRIIARAEMRMADEIDRGQASGEVPVHSGDRQTIAELQDQRCAHSTISAFPGSASPNGARYAMPASPLVEAAIKRALDEGHAPTKALILEAAKEISARSARTRNAPHALNGKRRSQRRSSPFLIAAMACFMPTRLGGLSHGHAKPGWIAPPITTIRP